jgi:phosphosulfolactate synthase
MNLPVQIPDRSAKPRSDGRTHIIDKGLPVGLIDGQLRLGGEFVDLVKLGWGSSLVTPNLSEKLDMYRSHDVEVCFGGTLFELAHLQGRVDDYAAWLRELDITALEISDGVLEMEGSAKVALIEKLSAEFTVYSEVGSKDAAAIVTPARWVRAIKDDLAAGAAGVILEGRESGTAGMYRESGEIRMGLIDEILESGIPVDRLVFEAPIKAQQVWLIKHIGPGVNFGNIAPEDALPLETLRLGLRADTLLTIHGPAARE